LYTADAAEGILIAAEHYNESEPVNVGTGQEIKIKDLVTMIADLSGYRGTIKWDVARPNGQPRRVLDTTRAKEKFGFIAQTPLPTGLKTTIDWYKKLA